MIDRWSNVVGWLLFSTCIGVSGAVWGARRVARPYRLTVTASRAIDHHWEGQVLPGGCIVDYNVGDCAVEGDDMHVLIHVERE